MGGDHGSQQQRAPPGNVGGAEFRAGALQHLAAVPAAEGPGLGTDIARLDRPAPEVTQERDEAAHGRGRRSVPRVASTSTGRLAPEPVLRGSVMFSLVRAEGVGGWADMTSFRLRAQRQYGGHRREERHCTRIPRQGPKSLPSVEYPPSPALDRVQEETP